VEASRFVEGEPYRAAVGHAGLRADPTATRLTSELLHGETFTVYDRRDGWAWGQNTADGYVGWVREEALRPGAVEPTHIVTDLRGFVFPEADLKGVPLDALPLGARVRVVGEAKGYLELADGGWIYAKHLSPLGWREPDPVRTAERLLGVPYLWGGRSPWGIDCSGLVQLALACSGVPCPRDSDMQREEAGELVSRTGRDLDYQRGDLVFFPGHVGLMLDGSRLIHATAFTMTVTVEPLDDVVLRVDPTRAGGILAVRRLSP
jgi:hypothetical protein